MFLFTFISLVESIRGAGGNQRTDRNIQTSCRKCTTTGNKTESPEIQVVTETQTRTPALVEGALWKSILFT